MTIEHSDNDDALRQWARKFNEDRGPNEPHEAEAVVELYAAIRARVGPPSHVDAA